MQMNTIFKTLLGINLCMFLGISYASNIFLDPPEVYSKYEDETCSIYLTGRVTPHMLVEFEKQSLILENLNCLEKKVVLNSGGGGTIPAYKIGRIIRNKNYKTYIPIDSQCNSSCGLIFIAGVERVIEKSSQKNSIMVFHSWSLSEKICITFKPNTTVVEEKYISYQLETYNYAIQMLGKDNGIKFGHLIFNTGCKDMVVASPDGLINLNIATKINQVVF